jgi:hypothetical protein
MEEGESAKIELAEEFFVLDDYGVTRQAECVECKRRACIRYGAVYFCAKHWEFLPEF